MCLGLSRLDWTSSLLTPNPLMDFLLPGPHLAVVGFAFAVILPLDIVDILALECAIPSANYQQFLQPLTLSL